MVIEFKGEFVTGKCNLDTTDMVCVPAKEKYNEVDLCLKSDNHKGMNISFCTIETKSLPFEEKKKLGYEIERRWNMSICRLCSKLYGCSDSNDGVTGCDCYMPHKIQVS